MTERQEAEFEVAELKMLHVSPGVTRLDKIRSKHIGGTSDAGQSGNKVRESIVR